LKKIGVLLVTYNHKAKTLSWIKWFLDMFGEHPDIYLLVLDSYSSDGTYESIKTQYPQVDIRRLNANYGCTTGRNIGIVELIKLGCEYYCSFDNDVFVEQADYFDQMISAMEKSLEVDGFTPILYWGEDRTIASMGSRRRWYGAVRTVKKESDNKRVDLICGGGGAFIRLRSFIKYGLYDNDIPPIGGQDYEWGVRVSKQGAILCYDPGCRAYHYHQKDQKDNSQKLAFYLEGRGVFLRKHLGLVNIVRDVIFLLKIVKNYRIKIVMKSYCNGLCKRIRANNHNYALFFKAGVEKYYAENI